MTAPQPPPAAFEQPPQEAGDRHLLASLQPLPDVSQRDAREQALRAAWEVYIASPELNFWDIGQRLCATPSYLRRAFDRFASEPGAPVLKPNGKL